MMYQGSFMSYKNVPPVTEVGNREDWGEVGQEPVGTLYIPLYIAVNLKLLKK